MTDRQVLDALGAVPYLKGVSAADLERLDGEASVRHFDAGQLVVRKGAAAKSMWVVVDGCVRLGAKSDPDARQLAVGDTIGEAEVRAGAAHPASARAEEPSTLLELSSEAVAQLGASGSTTDDKGHDHAAPWQAELRTAALLAWRSLVHRRSRVVTTLSSVTVIFTMVLLITGMAEYFRSEPGIAVDSFGADTWVVAPDATGVFTSAASLPQELGTQLASDEGVGAADPVVVARFAVVDGSGTHDVMLVGYAPDGLGSPPLRRGSRPVEGELVVSEALGVEVGAILQAGPKPFQVSGIADGITLFAGIPLIWMPLAQVQELLNGGAPTVTAFAVRGTAPAGQQWSVLDSDEVTDDAMRPMERAVSSIGMMSVLLWVVAALVIGAVAYVTALERTRDFAVIKAIGGSDTTLLTALALQSLFTALAAAALSVPLQALAAPLFPMGVTVPASALWRLPIIASVVAVLASAAGIRRIRDVDPAAAFGAAT